MQQMKSYRKTVLVVPQNHFDPSWRRCFERKAVLGNQYIASYAAVEKLIFDRWIAYGQTITEGQTAILRKYLDNQPDKKVVLSEMADSGHFACLQSGVTVQDTNLPAPEGLIRNFLVEKEFYRDLVGRAHPALRIVPTYDSFGNSANYPQIIRGIGADTTYKTCYHLPETKVWEGIDGSRVAYLDRFLSVEGLGTFEKHPWCPECLGKGCAVCQETGIMEVPELGYDALCHAMKNAAENTGSYTVLNVGGEEMLPEKDLHKAMASMQKQYPDVCFRIGTAVDIYLHYKKELETALETEPGYTKELNPTFQGCYVTRIKIKQTVRRLTYQLCTIESQLATAAYCSGKTAEMPDELNQAWRLVAFCQFHDVITGTLIDQAYYEAMDMLEEAEKIIQKYLPKQAVKTASDGQPSYTTQRIFNWGPHTITVDDKGILSIITNGKDLFGVKPYKRWGRPFRIGELVLEPDMGDAWATRVKPYFDPVNNQSLLQLGDYQYLEQVSDEKIVWKGCYKDDTSSYTGQGTDYMVRKLTWRMELIRGTGDRLEFKTDMDWDTDSRRIRIMFPVRSEKREAIYEIPFGYMVRKYEPEKLNYHKWSPDYMEYPAQNWVLQTIDKDSGVALLNKGLPCWRWYPGCFELSVLRSPQAHFVGNEQRNYDFNDYKELRDGGMHSFAYAILPYTNSLPISEISQIALDYNRGDRFTLPFTVSKPAIVSAWKPAQDGSGMILRFYNPEANEAETVLEFDKDIWIEPCNLLEDSDKYPMPQYGRMYRKHMRPFEITTVKLRME